MTAAGLDLLTMGRIGVDLYAEQIGVPFAEAQTFAKSIGGSPTNVAVAAARLGLRSAVFTAVGDDELGRYARSALEHFGVDTRFVGVHPTLPTPIVLAAMEDPENPWFVFRREPKAPDLEITLENVDRELARSVPILWITAGALSAEPSRATAHALLAERKRRPHVVLDLDYRPSFWRSEDEARATIGAAVDHATVAVGNRVECEIAVGTSDPDAAADALLRRGVALAIVKQGGDGVLVATADERAVVPAAPVEVVSGLGAGDAFGGAVCKGLLAGWPPLQIVEFANAAGAIVASRLLCADAMPTEAEVRELLEESRARRESSFRNDASLPGPAGGVRGEDAGSAAMRHISATEDEAAHRPAGAGDTRLRFETSSNLHLPAGTWDEVTPESAGWTYCGLRVVRVGELVLDTGDREFAVLPLAGSLTVEVGGHRFELAGRESVFSRVSDWAYLPLASRARLAGDAEVALASARAERRFEPAYVQADAVPVEIRGAGMATRQVVNFMSPEGFAGADRLICVEVLTPDGNWSSYPPHKHDDTPDSLANNEEIYYFRVGRTGAPGTSADGFALHRTYTADGSIDATVIVRDGDVFLVPRGYHGPSAAAPGYPLYYLNVMAGPNEQRTMAIVDDPPYAWVRSSWETMRADPRVPLITAA